MRKYRAILTAVFLTVIIIGYFYKNSLDVCTASYRPDLIIKINQRFIKAEKASTDQQKEKGLSGRSCIGSDQGMLFIFDKPDYYQFWMKDMKFPIDIVWVNKDKKVINVDSQVQPTTYPENFKPAQPAKYVLELKSKEARVLGISSGTALDF